ncbi:MAG TPA: hypothetical protein VJK02_10090 [Anaerolineales bacterium]|nr:hypothetical protein [Anaerolineales bacterium]
MNRSKLRIALPAGATAGATVAASLFLVVLSARWLPDFALGLLVLILPILGGIVAAWLCIR